MADYNVSVSLGGVRTAQLLAATSISNDPTPSVSGIEILLLGSNVSPTAITRLDDSAAFQKVILICISSSNPPTIADNATFLLSAAWAPDINDTITLFTVNGGASAVWREICRSAN
jgi:hypothetical protein